MARAEDGLTSLTDNLVRAKELAVAMANDTNNAESRAATAREIREIMDEVVLIGNSQFANRFVFAGFRNTEPPLTEDGNYVGDDGSIYVQVGPGSFRPINIPARYLFETDPSDRAEGHSNMVTTLENLYESLKDNSKDGIHSAMSQLDFHLEKTTSYQASLGGMSNAITQTQQRTERDLEFSKASLSQVEDADAFKVMSDFKKTESILQSTLLASNKVLQPSLLNFMQ